MSKKKFKGKVNEGETVNSISAVTAQVHLSAAPDEQMVFQGESKRGKNSKLNIGGHGRGASFCSAR